MNRYLLLILTVLSACSAPERTVGDIAEWKAEWIGAPWEGEQYDVEAVHHTPEFRKTVNLDGPVRQATAYICGLGMFEMSINGERVGKDYYAPNETMYGTRQEGFSYNIKVDDHDFSNYRVMYLAYDVTDMLERGENDIRVTLGEGWYSAYRKKWIHPFGSPRLLCQIELTMKDGSTRTIVSDRSWEVRPGPIVSNNIYKGEVYDARRKYSGGWTVPSLRRPPLGRLERQQGLEDRIMEVLDPKSITPLEDGSYEVDFGEYITGRIHLYGINAPEGCEIEVLHPISPEDDKSWTKSLWNGEYKYIADGTRNAEYAPSFNWYSFYKVIVKGWPGKLKARNIKAEAIYTDIRTTGKFSCSNPMLEAINRLYWRTQTDNLHMGTASDCPHREKGAYTGDGQVACVAMMHNFDANYFYRKWLRDMSDCRDRNTGYVPNGAPWHPGCGGGVAWGAAMCIIPWEHYLHYGDISVLEEHYEAMQGQLSFMESWRTPEGIMDMKLPRDAEKPVYYMNLGEWCPAYSFPDDRLVHTYFLWKCARYLSLSAAALGKGEDAARYALLAEDVRRAFHTCFYDPDRRSYGNNDGSNVFALHMGVPDEYKQDVVESLRKEIEGNGGHLNTGIFGTQIFFDVLCDNGLQELAYEAMTKKDQPSYGWWLEQGATTMWEYWDGHASRNHPMFGGGITWMYTRIAGLQADPAEPGYKHMIVRPTPVGDLSRASYETLTPFGKARVSWKKGRKGSFSLSILVPPGCHASVYMPGKTEAEEYGEGNHSIYTKD